MSVRFSADRVGFAKPLEVRGGALRATSNFPAVGRNSGKNRSAVRAVGRNAVSNNSLWTRLGLKFGRRQRNFDDFLTLNARPEIAGAISDNAQRIR